MRNLPKIITGVLLLFSLFITPTTAEITSVKLRSDDRHFILFEKFGFTNSGQISVAVSSVSVTSLPVTSTLSRPDPSRIGFLLLLKEAIPGFNQERNLCAIDSNFISLLFTFRDLSPLSDHRLFNKSHTVTFPGEYSLYFANCNPLSYVTMDVRTEFYNTDDVINGSKDYLSAGVRKLPFLYFIISLVYISFLDLWILACFKNKASLNTTHLLMGVILVIKLVTLLCGVNDLNHMRVTGTRQQIWDATFHVSILFKNVVLYIVLAKIRERLWEKKNNKVLMIVVTLQILATLVSVTVGKTGPFVTEWVTWNMALFLVECVCVAIILPVEMSVFLLLIRETRQTDDHEKKANRKYLAKFCLVAIGYLIIGWFIFVGNMGGINIITYKYQWVFIGLLEITSCVFYMVMFWMFRPFFQRKQYYVQVNNDVQEQEDVDVEGEEFELVGYTM